MNKYLFDIEFIIFDPQKIITKKNQDFKDKLINDDLLKILSFAIEDLENYKILDRMEPSISSIDENIPNDFFKPIDITLFKNGLKKWEVKQRPWNL